MLWRFKIGVFTIAVLLLITGCKDTDTAPGSTDQADQKMRVQFSYSGRYSQQTGSSYVVAGEHARISIGYNVIINVPGNISRTFKVVITPKAGAEPLEGIYETSADTYNKDYGEHILMIDDLRHIYSVYSPELEASCSVYDITDQETLIFEGQATIAALEARALDIISLDVKETTLSVAVTHYDDMRYEWRMDTSGANQLPPTSGDMGWSSEGFILREDTNIGVTIYDELGRFNNFLFIYPKP